MKRPVLILRPEPGASATAARATALALKTLIRPLFKIRPVAWAAPVIACDAILLTSANAVRFGGIGLDVYRGCPVFAVGPATADAARRAGFEKVWAGKGDANAAISAMIAAGCRNVLHFSGRDRTRLIDIPFKIETIVVYASETLSAPEIPLDAVALLHSARAARRFADIAVDKSGIAVVAISSAVAAAAGAGWQSMAVSDKPHDAAMLALATGLCETATG